SGDVHEIYAIRYGHHDRRSPANFVGGDPHDILQPLDYYVWAIVGPSGTFIVDTGFDAAMAKKRGRTLLKPVGEGLRAIGRMPDTVEHVIVRDVGCPDKLRQGATFQPPPTPKKPASALTSVANVFTCPG